MKQTIFDELFHHDVMQIRKHLFIFFLKNSNEKSRQPSKNLEKHFIPLFFFIKKKHKSRISRIKHKLDELGKDILTFYEQRGGSF